MTERSVERIDRSWLGAVARIADRDVDNMATVAALAMNSGMISSTPATRLPAAS